MTESEKQAFEIYELIRTTSVDRPTRWQSLEECFRKTAEWQTRSQALNALRKAEPDVHLAFLSRFFEWRKAVEQMDFSQSHPIGLTMGEAILIALGKAPKHLPPELIRQLLSEYRQDCSIVRYSFPLVQFLLLLTRDQITDEIRAELRKLHSQFAPSATGKSDKQTAQTREMIAGLMHMEGEKQLDPGRGPWSQMAFDEVRKKDEISRAGWEALLEHCRSLAQTVPGAKWKKRTQEMMAALGQSEAASTMLRWLELGPTPGQPREATSPIEDSAYQKGIVWCLGMSRERETAIAIADFTLACLRKVAMIGAVSQKVGFAGVLALGTMECTETVSQLARLRAKVRYAVALKLIEKAIQQAAQRSGLTIEEMEDVAVFGYGLNERGIREIEIGDATASVCLREDGKVGVAWRNADGKLVKSAPAHIKKAYVKEVREVGSMAKEVEQAYLAQKARLDLSFIAPRSIPLKHWRKYFIDHPLLGLLGRRLIWVFSDEHGGERVGIWSGGGLRDNSGEELDLSVATRVWLWHPISSDEVNIQRWRERVFADRIRQPFRQAFREFYQVANDERQTRMYSNRFAGVLMRQHQLASLCRARGWEYRLMGTGFDGFNVPTKKLACWNLQVEFAVELPPDRDESLRDSALGEQSGAGINLFVASDQVRFYRDRREVAVDEVPAILFSEVMRDVDLFTSVCSIGEDEGWADQGDRGTGVLSDRTDIQEITEVIALRAEVLSRVLPYTPIGGRCKVEKDYLTVCGQLGAYRVHLGMAWVLLLAEPVSRLLKIPKKIMDSVTLDLADVPVELDYRVEMILRQAYVLADDWKIDSPELVRQFMPK